MRERVGGEEAVGEGRTQEGAGCEDASGYRAGAQVRTRGRSERQSLFGGVAGHVSCAPPAARAACPGGSAGTPAGTGGKAGTRSAGARRPATGPPSGVATVPAVP